MEGCCHSLLLRLSISIMYLDETITLCFFCKGETEDCPTFQIIGDNVDLHQRATHQSMERRDKDHHWFNLYAARDSVVEKDLPNDGPITDVAKVPLQHFLPSVEDCDHL